MNYTIHHVKSIDSTNTFLKELAKQGAPEGYVLVADEQTGGRGRLGRNFFSPSGGLYASILVRPSFALSPAVLTCMTAVAVSDTISSFGETCSIKWVNDIYCRNGKAGGILVEGAVTPAGLYEYVVIGIGLNLSMPSTIPSDLRNIITSVFDNKTDAAFRDSFLQGLLISFRRYYETLPTISFWKKYCDLQNCYGRKVSFTQDGRTYTGIAESIDNEFRLIVRAGSSLFSLERGEVNFLL
jgi:BirA family biotin operon repressor/biotin-[acetyl-CoA-carboxylase] ligase